MALYISTDTIIARFQDPTALTCRRLANRRKRKNSRIPLIEEDDVSAELLRKHVSEVCPDRVPGGQSRPAEGLHVLPRGLLQVRDLRHQVDPENLLQQSAHDQRQGGVL